MVLVRDAVVQRLADHPGVVLRQLHRKERAARQLAHREVADAGQHLVHVQQERWAEVLVVQVFVALVLQQPTDARHSRRQQRRGLRLAQQQQCGMRHATADRQLRLVQERRVIPACRRSGLGRKLGGELAPGFGDRLRLQVIQ